MPASRAWGAVQQPHQNCCTAWLCCSAAAQPCASGGASPHADSGHWTDSCGHACRAVLVQFGFFGHMKRVMGFQSFTVTRPLIFAASFMLLFSIVIALFKDIPDVKGDGQVRLVSQRRCHPAGSTGMQRPAKSCKTQDFHGTQLWC